MGLEEWGGWPGLLRVVTAGGDLTIAQTEAAMGAMLAGEATAAQIAAFIVALRMKGESVDEMTGLVRAMYAVSTPLPLRHADDVDIVGAGGALARQTGALNVSTMASFVAAGAGVRVCKHGNRRASSTSGSFDLLEALGGAVELPPEGISRCVDEAGVGFAFARSFHPSMRHVGPVRTEIGIPTVFNVLGPLANPAKVTRQVVGVADARLAERMLRVLVANGSQRAWVVTGDGPLDELSTTGPSQVVEWHEGVVRSFEVTPEAAGLTRVEPHDIVGGDAARNAELFARVVDGKTGAVREIVAFNTAAALVVAGVADSLADGVERAFASIDSGAAGTALDRWRTICTELLGA
jgi:anthranilate phosphoribosyltransferase